MIQHCSLRHPTSAADSCYAGGTGERSSCSITLLTPACAPTTWACGFHCCVRCAINVEATLKRTVPSRPHLSHAMETEPVLESKAAVDSTLDDASYDHNTEGEPTESAHEWLETRFGMVTRKIASCVAFTHKLMRLCACRACPINRPQLPDSSFAWFRAGVGFYNKALHEFAIDCLSEAVQIDPNNVGRRSAPPLPSIKRSHMLVHTHLTVQRLPDSRAVVYCPEPCVVALCGATRLMA